MTVRLLHLDAPARDADAIAHLARALLARPPAIAFKHFYDALGCRLFNAITELPEYDLTRNEAAIFEAHGAAIVAAWQARRGDGAARTPALVDLGAGDAAKAERWLLGPLRPQRYVAVDVAGDFLAEVLPGVAARHPDVEVVGAVHDFGHALALPSELVPARSLVFYPGSSIGNFSPGQASRLLRQVRTACRGGGLLIGVDLLKTVDRMEAAYDDALGVTAAFNLNALNDVNRMLGADFDVREWRHVAFFDPATQRVEMHLEARHAVTVRWPGGERRFSAGERIHTENAYKWPAPVFEALLREAGFTEVQVWSDAGRNFAVWLALG